MTRVAHGILLLCIIHFSCAVPDQPRPATRSADLATKTGFRGDRKERPDATARQFPSIHAQGGDALVRDLKFTHLTTSDGLSQAYVTAILQDHRGFMWFATRDGLNRYDGNTFVTYKHNPNDPGTLSSNFIQDLIEDDHGYLWIATNTGLNKFDSANERVTRYVHDPNNPNSIGGAYVTSIARDSRGFIWLGIEDGGVDKFDPTTGTFTHFRNDSDGHSLGRNIRIAAGNHGNIWVVGDRGLVLLNQQTGQITRPPATRNGLGAENAFEDEAGNLWMVANSPIVGLVKYDRQGERLTIYPLSGRAAGMLASTAQGGSVNSKLLADGQNGLWVPSGEGLYYFDRRTERFTYRFQHDESNPDSLDSNAVLSVYRDRSGVLWVGTENAGLNVLNFRQEQFAHHMHRSTGSNSLSPGRVKAIYQDSNGVLWVGLFPRALNRLDRKTGQITRYVPNPGVENMLGRGTNINALYKDAAGYLWVGGGGSGLVRFDERTGRFKHYRHNPHDSNSLISDNVITIYGDRNGRMWVGGQSGISHFDPATDRFANYQPDPTKQTSLLNWIWSIYQDRSGTLWLGTFGGALIRFDAEAKTFTTYLPDSRDPHRLTGGGLTSIHEDRTGTLWVGAFDGLYRFDRQNGTFARYTESQGLPSSTIRCIQEDRAGRLWLSTQKGISRFDHKLETFRNYDVSDGLQSNEFSDGCFQSRDGEMFFGGSNGFNAFFPEHVRDNPYVPPVVITSFKIFNNPVPIGAKSVLKKSIAYVDSLTLSYRDNVFSFEFAALSYVNSHRNRYRYKLENFEPRWNEMGSKQRLATYTNLDPGKYVFRVQGSNSDGIWNEEGVSLPIIITPPWYRENWFRLVSGAGFLALLWAAYQFRFRQLHHEFNMRVEGRVEERMRIARELHDTLLQSFQVSLILMQAARNIVERRPEKAVQSLDKAIVMAAGAVDEGRSAIQNMRIQPAGGADVAQLLTVAAQELAHSGEAAENLPVFRVTVEGERQDLQPLLQDEVYRIALELLRNAFRHAQAGRIEVEIRYESQQLRVHVRDDGKGIDHEILKVGGRAGHWGLPGMRERASRFGGKLEFWSEAGAGTEAVLTVPAAAAYANSNRGAFSSLRRMLWTHER